MKSSEVRVFGICTWAILVFWSASARANQAESWFPHDDVLSISRAEVVIDLARDFFWTDVSLPDGSKPIPKNETERATIPIPKLDALALASAARLAGQAQWCGIDHLPYSKFVLGASWGRYQDIKQIVFASVLFGMVTEDVRHRLKVRGECAISNRDTTEKHLGFVLKSSK